MGLTFGTRFNPRTVPMLFGVVVLPLTFLGGTYYPWTKLAPVKVGGFSWLQTLVLVNPLIYITEGFRAALTSAPHMHLYVVYPALLGFTALFLWLGNEGFPPSGAELRTGEPLRCRARRRRPCGGPTPPPGSAPAR